MKQRALDIDTLLHRHRPLWQLPAYHTRRSPPWQHDYPDLAEHLMALSDQQVTHFAADDEALLHNLVPVFPDAATLLDCIRLPQLPTYRHQEPPTGLPGRKWQQIHAFCQALQAGTGEPICIDWCAGKGYLSAALHRHLGATVQGLEIDPALVSSGTPGLPPGTSLHCCDVLSDEVESYLGGDRHIVALHACGGLHQRLLRLAANGMASRVTLSPCCYHRFIDTPETLSTALCHSPLTLRRQDLRLAVRQTATARQGEQRARRTLQAWQLGFRAALSDAGYHAPAHLPSLPHPTAKAGFAAFCQQLADKAGIANPIPGAHHEAQGWQHLAAIERVELAAMAFRRALELRCVLDGALLLEEQGFDCRLEVFCPSSLTPRNLLLQATRHR